MCNLHKNGTKERNMRKKRVFQTAYIVSFTTKYNNKRLILIYNNLNKTEYLSLIHISEPTRP